MHIIHSDIPTNTFILSLLLIMLAKKCRDYQNLMPIN